MKTVKNIVTIVKNMSVDLQGTWNPGSVHDAWLDMFLLSRCQELILTFGSSFGSMAAGIAGVKPYMMLYGSPVAERDLQHHDFYLEVESAFTPRSNNIQRHTLFTEESCIIR